MEASQKEITRKTDTGYLVVLETLPYDYHHLSDRVHNNLKNR